MKKLKVTVDGQVYEVEVEALEAPETGAASQQSSSAPPASGHGRKVPSPLAGKVVEIKVSVGDLVEEGDTLLVLEAMKMNTLVSSSEAGTVRAILVGPGDMVEEGQGLVALG